MCPDVEPLLYRPNLLLISTKVLMSYRKAWLRSSLAIANIYSTEDRQRGQKPGGINLYKDLQRQHWAWRGGSLVL